MYLSIFFCYIKITNLKDFYKIKKIILLSYNIFAFINQVEMIIKLLYFSHRITTKMINAHHKHILLKLMVLTVGKYNGLC